MRIKQTASKKPDVEICLTPEEATALRVFCGALSRDEVAEILLDNGEDEAYAETAHTVTLEIFDQLYGLDY